MKNATSLMLGGMFWGAVVGLIGLGSVFPTRARAQATGKNAVYDSTGACSPCAKSPAFIDASVFGNTRTDICTVLKFILTPLNGVLPSTGGVIDARGLPATGTSMTCTSTTPSPWAGITNPPPSTILLPATTATVPISIPSTWSLPPNTHLIGEGDSIASSTTISTTIQAQSPSFSGSMIQFGSPSCIPPLGGPSTCAGISVENLTLDGQGQAINGIVNPYSTDQSYVDHVSLYQILGTGLSVSGSATNSGPYSNITFDTGGSGLTATACAQILGLSGTHGIHGLSCTSQTNDSTSAVLLDSSNNSIEDVTIAGFYNGIVVGSQAPAHGNVLVNISDNTKACNPVCPPSPVNMVHIEAYTTNGEPNVTDLSIMGASNDTGT